MSRRKSWSPYAVAGLRDNLVRNYRGQPNEADKLLHKITQLGLDEATQLDLADGLLLDFRRLERAADAACEAELFWVSSDMAAVAIDASQDIPSLDGQDVNWPVGMMVFETSLPGRSSLDRKRAQVSPGEDLLEDDLIPIDGLLWFPTANGIHIEILTKSKNAPEGLQGPRAGMKSHSSAELPLPVDFTDAVSIPDGLDGQLLSRDLGVAAFLATAWHLMAMPAVAEARDVQPRTGESRPAESVTVPVGQVRVVDARPMRTVPSDPGETTGESGGRHQSTRWVVRGHWRQQAHGPGRSQRRTQWIESYIKGPEGAPLAPHTLVRAWRR